MKDQAKGDIKRFKAHLNALAGSRLWKNGRRGNKVRQYGDYLYAQDREMFLFEMKNWLTTLPTP